MNRRLGMALTLALIAGVLQALSIALPGSGSPAWWLQIGSLALLAGLLLRAPQKGEALALGWVFAVAWLAVCWWWLFISMHVYGGLSAPMAVLAVLALAAALGFYYALAAGLVRWSLQRHRVVAGGDNPPGLETRPLRFSLAFAAAWLLAELARGQWFTGFPWGAAGYAHVEGPLAVLAPWVGVYGVGFVAALASAWTAAAVLGWVSGRTWPHAQARTGDRSLPATDSRRSVSRLLGLLLALALLLGAMRLLPAGDNALPATQDGSGRLSVALLQGNIAQDEKFRPGSGVPQALAWYGEQLRAARAQLVVAPETAIPLLPQDLPDAYLDEIAEHFRTGQQAALLGLPLGGERTGYTNSVVGLRPRADAYRYDKHHLVPFGEFIPPLFRWFTDLMNIPLGDFSRGGVGQPSFAWQGQWLAPNICYEDLFGEELAARFADPARAPTVFVNVSNIAWFGDSLAIEQHLHISRMRALEFRRPMVRATNTGATAIIDHQGRVTARLPRLTRGVLEGEVEGRSGLTAYARWAAAWGLAPLWALGIGLLAAAAWVGAPRKIGPCSPSSKSS